MRGKYIVIEGAEGVGKTTMVQKVANALQQAGLPVRIMREPDSQNDLTARAIRHLTQDPRYPMNTRTEVLLYNAARSQSLEVIRHTIENGVICLVDRSYLTTLAIQYYGRGDVQDYGKINQIIDFAVGDMQPDLMLVLDAPVDILKGRTKHRYSGDRFDNLNEAFLERVRAGYLWEARQRNLPVIYATGDVDEVFKQVWQHVTNTLAIRDKDKSATKLTSVAEVIAKKQAEVATPTAAQTAKSEPSTPKIGAEDAAVEKDLPTKIDAYELPNNLPESLRSDFGRALDTIQDIRKVLNTELHAYAKKERPDEDVEREIEQALGTLSQVGVVPSANAQRFDALAKAVLPTHHGDTTTSVALTSYYPHNELEIVADMLYERSDTTLQSITNKLQTLPYETKTALLHAYAVDGQTQAFAAVSYEFDILSSYATLRELTQNSALADVITQRPTPRYGYTTPAIIDDAGLAEQYASCFDISLQLYSILQQLGDTEIAGTATLLGHLTRWKTTLSADKLPRLTALVGTVSAPTRELIATIIDHITTVHPLVTAELNTAPKQ